MIPNLPINTVYAIHMRAASSSGGKDWVGAVTSNCEIHTYWGKTGCINQHGSKDGNNVDLQKIVNQKIHGKDRYQRVDEFTQKNGWSSQYRPTASNQPPPSAKASASIADPIINFDEAPVAAGALNWDF